MRKLETLRNMARKARWNDEAIYFFNVDSFRRKGDLESPYAQPIIDKDGLCGVSIQHVYRVGRDIFSFEENFLFRKINPVTFR